MTHIQYQLALIRQDDLKRDAAGRNLAGRSATPMRVRLVALLCDNRPERRRHRPAFQPDTEIRTAASRSK